jgi:hypothetical protein
MSMAAAKTNWRDKLIATVSASPGKSSFAGFLAVILVVLWARFLLWGHHPASASAATARQAAASVQAGRAGDFPVFSDEAAALQKWAHQPLQPLTRNPFDIPLDEYPRDASAHGYSDLVTKSATSQADQQEQRQILIDNVRIAAGSLKLQSTVIGAHPSAMVNGQMVREGDDIAGFRVLKIEARQIIVEREGIELAVLME